MTTEHAATEAGRRPARPCAPHAAREDRWQKVWEELGVFKARDDGSRERRYLLTMFPYPSGDLHMGHAEVFALEDVVARYWRLRGFDVLNPVGWDSFGLPAENAAIRRGESPAVFTAANIETQARSIRRYGVSFDWSRRLHTSDPEYYRWTQWLFLRMREHGLAYRAAALVNWCPHDETVLANEQVVGGQCERCGTAVVRRDLTQWFLRITDYAERLLDDMDLLRDGWPEHVLTMQRNWIGRSVGARIRFEPAPDGAAGTSGAAAAPAAAGIEVFTTRPETLPGVTFLAVAPESDVADRLCRPEHAAELAAYRSRTTATPDIERSASGRASGVFLGSHVLHPLTGRPLPVWSADYVLPGHGTGAVMGVPAHDERDRTFARRHGLEEVATDEILDPGWPAGSWAGTDAAGDATRWLERTGRGAPATTYRLRDWLVSRQRYWGAPIPIIHCPTCGEVPVPDDQLPVLLPDLRGDDLAQPGVSPLAAATDWVGVACPGCGGRASRDTDTMDTFVDSSWYFLRYCSPDADDRPFDPDAVRRWMPAALYVGGAEHAILHLLYSRFVTKVLHDLGLVDVVEPFTALLNQGQVRNGGRSMSKSLGNGVSLGTELDRHGVDAVRLAMVFAGPAEDDIDWADVSAAGMERFLRRALRLADDVGVANGALPTDPLPAADQAVQRATHRTVREIEHLLDTTRFNVAVARLMELVSTVRRAIDTAPGAGPRPHSPAVRAATETVAVVLSLFAPYTAEEMWERLGHQPSVAGARWPTVDEALLVEEETEAVVQVGGRVRDRFMVPTEISAEALRERALARPAVVRAAAGQAMERVVVRPPGLVAIVLAPGR